MKSDRSASPATSAACATRSNSRPPVKSQSASRTRSITRSNRSPTTWNCSRKAWETHLTDAEKVIENERLDSIRDSIERVQAIVRRLDEMTRKGEYETRDYLAGKRMADLAPREDGQDSRATA